CAPLCLACPLGTATGWACDEAWCGDPAAAFDRAAASNSPRTSMPPVDGRRMRSAPRLLPPRRRTVGFGFASWPLSRGRRARLRPRPGGHLRRINQIDAAALTPDTFGRLAGAKSFSRALEPRAQRGSTQRDSDRTRLRIITIKKGLVA